MALFNFFGKKEIETPADPQTAEPEKKAMKITKKSTASNPLLSDASLSVVDKSILLREQEDMLIKQKIQVDNREITLNKREKEVEALLEELKSKLADQVTDAEGGQLSEGQAFTEGIDVEDATNQLLQWEEKLIEKEKELGEFHAYLEQKQADIEKAEARLGNMLPESGAIATDPGRSAEGHSGIDVEDATAQLVSWEERLLEKEKELGDFHAYLETKQAELEEIEARLGEGNAAAQHTIERTTSFIEESEEEFNGQDVTSQLQLWEEKLIAKENELLELENTLAHQLEQIKSLQTPSPDGFVADGQDDLPQNLVLPNIDETSKNSQVAARLTTDLDFAEVKLQHAAELVALQTALEEKDQQVRETQALLEEYSGQLQTQNTVLQLTQAKLDEMQNATEGNLDVVASEVLQIQEQVASLTEQLQSAQQLNAVQQVQLIEKERLLEERSGEVSALEATKQGIEAKFQEALGTEQGIAITLKQRVQELEDTLFSVRNELQETVSLKISAEEEFTKQLSAQQDLGKKAQDLLETERSIVAQQEQLQEWKTSLESREKDIVEQLAALDEKNQSFLVLQESVLSEQSQKIAQIAESEQQLAALEKELKEKEDWILQQQTIAAESMLNSKDMEQLWAEKEAMIAKKEQAIVDSKAQISELKVSAKEQQKDIEKLTKEFAKSTQQIAKLEQELMSQQETARQQLAEHAALIAQESALKLEIDTLNAALVLKQQEESAATMQKEGELATRSAELAALEQQLTASQSSLAAGLEQVAHREEAISKEQEKIAQALEELQAQQSKLATESQQLLLNQAEIEQKQAAQTALDQTFAEQSIAFEAAKATFEEDQASFVQKVVDFENANAEVIEQQGLMAEKRAALSADAEAVEALKGAIAEERVAFELARTEGENILAQQKELLQVQLDTAKNQQQELEAIKKGYEDKEAEYKTLLSLFGAKEDELAAQIEAFAAEKAAFLEKNSHIEASVAKFDELEQQLNDKSNQISLVEQLLQDRDAQLNQREKELQLITKEMNQQGEQLQKREQELNQWQKRLENQQKPVAEEAVEKPSRPKQAERPVEVVPDIINFDPFNVNISLENGEALEAELEGTFTGNDIIETLIDNELIEGNSSYAIYWEEGRKWIDLTEKIGVIGLTENSSIKVERR